MYSYAAIIRRDAMIPKKPKPPSQNQPLDAEDLSRRLSAHLSAQEKASRRANGGRRLHLRLRPLSISSAPIPAPAPEQDSPPPYEAVPAPYNHEPDVAAKPDGGRRERQVPAPVAEPELELEKFSSREEGRRSSRRASFLSRLKWHPGRGS